MAAETDHATDPGDIQAGDAGLYLGDRWLAEADAGLSALQPVPAPVTVGFTVRGGPQGDRHYRLVLGPDRVGVDRDQAAALTLTMDWDLAVAVNQGRSSAQQAVLDGRIEVSGNPVALLGYQDQLSAVDDVLADLRTRTRY